MSSLANRTVGSLVAPDGSLIERPATLIEADDARILRNYFFWALSNHLEPELFCNACFDHTRETKTTYDINEQHLVIICHCMIRSFIGPWTKPEAIVAPKSAPVEQDGAADVQLPMQAAILLRKYKKVLQALGLKEALRCKACYTLNLPDGCDAQVLSSQIRIRCRCSDRRYVGTTF